MIPATLKFDPRRDWGFHIGGWYIIRKSMSGDDLYSQKNIEDWANWNDFTEAREASNWVRGGNTVAKETHTTARLPETTTTSDSDEISNSSDAAANAIDELSVEVLKPVAVWVHELWCVINSATKARETQTDAERSAAESTRSGPRISHQHKQDVVTCRYIPGVEKVFACYLRYCRRIIYLYLRGLLFVDRYCSCSRYLYTVLRVLITSIKVLIFLDTLYWPICLLTTVFNWKSPYVNEI